MGYVSYENYQLLSSTFDENPNWNMVGPHHSVGVNFPNMILWGSDVGHVPFIEKKPDLEKAIINFQEKYVF